MFILDTHTLLWYLVDSKEMSNQLKEEITNADEIAVSIVSLWEIAIKQSIGKLKLGTTITEIEKQCLQNDILILPIKTNSLDILQTLPKIHGDPFDRLIISQTISETGILITKDSIIPQYPVRTLWK